MVTQPSEAASPSSVTFNVLQEVNENSLKRLNGYLDNLQKPGPRSVQPMKFTFYVRDTKDNSDVQPDLLSSGTVSFNIAHNICEFCLKKSKTSRFLLVLRIPVSEFHPAHKRCLEHSDERLEVLQSAHGAHKETESKCRDIEKST